MSHGIKEDIDLINTFSSDFFTKTSTIGTQIGESMQKLDTVIADEKTNEIYLTNLEKKASDKELTNIHQSLETYKNVLEEKYKAYINVIEGNSKKIRVVSDVINNNKQLINSIYKLMNDIETQINTIDSKLGYK